MKNITFLLLSFLLISCEEKVKRFTDNENGSTMIELVPKTIGAIPVPKGYERMSSPVGSFASWLRTVPLKTDKTVYLYNGQLKPNQEAQFVVVNISTGKRDLQQCADVVMRFRAEYLFAEKNYADIAFMDYKGKWYKWQGGDNRHEFDNYLENVFGWCGSASLEKQLIPVADFNKMAAGDVLIQGGFPGHAMLVVDMAVNKQGNKIFMLAQGYQPAQDIHVVINPADEKLSPWYQLTTPGEIITPEWRFKKSSLRTW